MALGRFIQRGIERTRRRFPTVPLSIGREIDRQPDLPGPYPPLPPAPVAAPTPQRSLASDLLQDIDLQAQTEAFQAQSRQQLAAQLEQERKRREAEKLQDKLQMEELVEAFSPRDASAPYLQAVAFRPDIHPSRLYAEARRAEGMENASRFRQTIKFMNPQEQTTLAPMSIALAKESVDADDLADAISLYKNSGVDATYSLSLDKRKAFNRVLGVVNAATQPSKPSLRESLIFPEDELDAPSTQTTRRKTQETREGLEARYGKNIPESVLEEAGILGKPIGSQDPLGRAVAGVKEAGVKGLIPGRNVPDIVGQIREDPLSPQAALAVPQLAKDIVPETVRAAAGPPLEAVLLEMPAPIFEIEQEVTGPVMRPAWEGLLNVWEEQWHTLSGGTIPKMPDDVKKTIAKYAAEFTVPSTAVGVPLIKGAGRGSKLLNITKRGAVEGYINMAQDRAGRVSRGEEPPTPGESTLILFAGGGIAGFAPEALTAFNRIAKVLGSRAERKLVAEVEPDVVRGAPTELIPPVRGIEEPPIKAPEPEVVPERGNLEILERGQPKKGDLVIRRRDVTALADADVSPGRQLTMEPLGTLTARTKAGNVVELPDGKTKVFPFGKAGQRELIPVRRVEAPEEVVPAPQTKPPIAEPEVPARVPEAAPAREVAEEVVETGVPKRGSSGAQEVLDLKEETLLRPGKLTQQIAPFPGIKQTLSKLNRAVTIPRKILASYNAQESVLASLRTEFAALRRPVVEGLQNAWDAQAPRYTGSADNKFKNTIKDWFDNPDFYDGAGQELLDAAKAYDDVSNQILNRVHGKYNVDILPYFSEKEGARYLATVESREALDKTLDNVLPSRTSSSLATKSSRAKGRVYEGAFQRSERNPDFVAETDLAELTNIHDHALARMSGNETFRLGSGGKTRLELMEELHPDLYKQMTGLRLKLERLRGTAGRLNERTGRAIDDFLEAPDGSLGDLADSLDVVVTRGARKGMDVKAINAEVKSVRQDLRKLRPGWKAAGTGDYVWNDKTFRFHMPEEAEAVNKILLTKLPIGDGLLQAIDEVRLFAFAADVSPLTIQGLLGFLSDPITGASSLKGIMKALLSPEELVRVTEREPELVKRFTLATGRPFGELGGEFVQAKRGIERLPGGRQLNDRLMSAVELLRYNQWKVDTDRVMKWGNVSQEVADAEAANALSKVIPALSAPERGISKLQSRVERMPVISTSFIGGPATLIKDATSGLAKLTASRALSPADRWAQLAGREQLAIFHLVSIAGTISTAAVGTHILSGWSPEEAVKATLDPTSPRFLSLALGKQRRIPLGGPLRSVIRAFLPQKVGEVDGIPIYAPFTGVGQWLQNKVTPALSAPYDLARDKDYFGGKIAEGSFPENLLRMVWYAANSAMPLVAAEPSEALRTGEAEITDVGLLAERGAAQFAGIDLRETSRWENLRMTQDEVTREMGFGESYDSLDAARKLKVDEDSRVQERQQALAESPYRRETPRGRYFELGEEKRTESLVEQERYDTNFSSGSMGGKIWRTSTGDLKGEIANFLAGGQAALGIEFEEKDSNTIDQAIQAYYSIDLNDPLYTNPRTGEVDYDLFNVDRESALAPLGPTDRTLVQDLIEQYLTPLQKEYKADVERIVSSGFWNIPDLAWDNLRSRVPSLPADYATYLQLRKDQLSARIGPEAAEAFASSNEVSKAYAQVKAALRERWKAQPGNDEIIRLLSKWEYDLINQNDLPFLGIGGGFTTSIGRVSEMREMREMSPLIK